MQEAQASNQFSAFSSSLLPMAGTHGPEKDSVCMNQSFFHMVERVKLEITLFYKMLFSNFTLYSF